MAQHKRYEEMSDEQLEMLHDACSRFESAYAADPAIRCEDFLADASDELSSILLVELLEIEVFIRKGRGEHPQRQDYKERFPNRQRELAMIFSGEDADDATERLSTQVLKAALEQKPSDSITIESGNLLANESAQESIHGIFPGTQIGPYRLVKQIGEGGMGTVWQADQEQPVRRSVALKIIKAGMDTEEVIRRFEAERQALAMMEHPCIAKVLDAGATVTGRPYFVMELVDGIPITKYCNRHHFDAVQRLKLFTVVCRAVQHAHQKGIIHRDIKPSNILVGESDGEPLVKVIDFGLAKATEREIFEQSMYTAHGQLVGTPAYMSPEQADPACIDIDTRTDVYALGVLLYQLLTGLTPIDTSELRSAGFAEIQRVIREKDPPLMSQRFGSSDHDSITAAENRNSDSKRLSQLLRGDLDLIVMKSLEKERNRRYDSPSQFAEDVERFLNNEPIEARAPSAAYRFKKLVRRNKALVATVSVVAAALILGTVVSASQAIIADRALKSEQRANAVAQRRLEQLEKVNETLGSIFRDLNPGDEEKGGMPLREQLSNRLTEVSGSIDEEAIGDRELVASLQLTISEAQRQLDNHEDALRLAEKAAKTFAEELGPEHPNTLAAIMNIGLSQVGFGNYTEAIEALEQVYSVRLKTLGPDDEATLEAQSRLARCFGEAGRMQEGIALQEDAYDKMRRILGPQHAKTIDSLNFLSVQVWHFGEDEQRALELHELVLEMRLEQLGEKHFKTIFAKANLANVLGSLGDNDRSAQLLNEAVEDIIANVGNDHDLTVELRGRLAFTMLASGDEEEGFKLLEATVEQIAKRRGESHPQTLIYMNSLAYNYEQHGRLQSAVKLHAETLAKREATLGADHLDTLTSRCNLAWCHRRLEEFEPAIANYSLAVTGLEETAGQDHPETLGCARNFARTLFEAEEYEQCAERLAKWLPIHRHAHPDHWQTFRLLAFNGISLLEQAKYDQAETDLLDAYTGLLANESDLPDEAQVILVRTIKSLVRLYQERGMPGDIQESERWQETLDAREV